MQAGGQRATECLQAGGYLAQACGVKTGNSGKSVSGHTVQSWHLNALHPLKEAEGTP